MERSTDVIPNSVVIVPLGGRLYSCVAEQHVTPSTISLVTQQPGSPDARSMSEISSGFASATNSATAASSRAETAPPSSNSNSSESCACAQTGSAESLSALIDALQARHDAFDRSSLPSLELMGGLGNAKWSASSSTSTSKSLLQERYGEDWRRMNFAARVIQHAYRTHRLKCTFTKRCNEKRLSARISSSCIELDANKDVLTYFAATSQRDTLAQQAHSQSLRAAQAEPTCKLIDSSSSAKSGNHQNPSSNPNQTATKAVSSTSNDGTALIFDDDDENAFIRQCEMQRVDSETKCVPKGNSRAPCACCDCALAVGRIQLTYAQAQAQSQTQTQAQAQPNVNVNKLLYERNAFGYPSNANANVNLHPQSVSSHVQLLKIDPNASASWRNATDAALNAQQQQSLMAPRTFAPSAAALLQAGACACQACFANGAPIAHPQTTHNRFYMTAPYSLAFFPNSQAEASTGTGTGTGPAARITSNCPQCASDQLHAHTAQAQMAAQRLGVQPQLLSNMARGKVCDCAATRLTCACEHCQMTTTNGYREVDAIIDNRMRKGTVKSKSIAAATSNVSCASFLAHDTEHQAAAESLYEISPYWKAKRAELAASGQKAAAQVQSNAVELRQRRHYRVALNLFNRKPDVGVRFLIETGFVKADDPATLAGFLLRKRGFSRQVISEYLGSKLPTGSSSKSSGDKVASLVDRVLEYYANGIDMRQLDVLAALRRFQQYIRFCGEAQRIERFAEAFASAYCRQNARTVAAKFRGGVDSVLLLAYAIVMLNTDLHNANVRADRKMKLEEFVRNLGGVDAGGDFDRPLLESIYEQLRNNPLQPSADHVSQVQKLENCIVSHRHAAASKKNKSSCDKQRRVDLHLATPERRLVCYCRLYKLSLRRAEKNENERDEADRQRDVFLLNDLLLVAKERVSHAASKKRDAKTRKEGQSSATAPHAHALGYYELCDVYPLSGMQAYAFDSPSNYPYGIRIIAPSAERHDDASAEKANSSSNSNSTSMGSTKSASASTSASESSCSSQDGVTRVTLLFYARSNHDRSQFLSDLHETILEATETEYVWNRYKMAGH